MKINKIFLFATLASAALFTACSDDDDKYAGPGEWNATPDYANIYFKQTSVTESVDPTAPTKASFQVYRRVQHAYTWGKDSQGNDSIIGDNITTALPAKTVNLDIVENTNNVFKISDATFAEGDTVATVNVTYDGAEIGVPHVLKVSTSDPSLVSYYSQDITFTYTVTRVKWNSLGTGTFEENYYIRYSSQVEIMQRDDAPNQFRIMHPLDEALEKAKANPDWDPGEFNGKQPEYIELTVSKGGIVTYEEFNSGCFNLTYGADVWIRHPKWASSTAAESNWTHNKVLSYQADGKTPGQIQLAPWYYMDGVGGWNHTQNDGDIVITFPGFTPEYTAEIDDYEWEEVFSGIFTSTQLGTKKDKVKLYKGVQDPDLAATEKGCYDRFEKANGVPYRIEAPYAEGYDLLFCITEDGKIVVPEDFESQPLGFKAVGKQVFGAINTKGSSFVDILLELNITFQDEDGEVVYGNATEQLLNFVYTKDMVLGEFTYYGVQASDGKQYKLGNFTIEEHPTVADSLIIKNLYLEGAEVPARVDLNDAKLYVESLAYLGIEEDEGTPYYIFTYAKSGSNDIAFDINTDGTLTTTDLALVGSPDLQTLYYWFNASQTTFVPVANQARSFNAVNGKATKKGAKIGRKGITLRVK